MHNKPRSYMTFDDLAEWEETTTVCKIVSGDQEYTLMPGETVELDLTAEMGFINPTALLPDFTVRLLKNEALPGKNTKHRG